MKNFRNPIIISLFFLALAGLVRFVIAPQMELIPEHYSHDFNYEVVSQIRESIDGEWMVSEVSVNQFADTIIANDKISIIQNYLFWFAENGDVIFQSTGLYGVDRTTRMNLTGYGNAERVGQYLFPTHIQMDAFTFWDAMFIGPRHTAFEKVEELEGLKVYKFHFSGKEMDETKGYENRPEVPEKYRVLTDGEGTLWIEPLTGILVDYEEEGVSNYVNPKTGQEVIDFFSWNARFSKETRTTQLALAGKTRLLMLLVEVWLPGLLVFTGMFFVGVIMFRLINKNKNEDEVGG